MIHIHAVSTEYNPLPHRVRIHFECEIRIRTTTASFQPCPHRVRKKLQDEIHVRTASAKIIPHLLRIRADAVRTFADCPWTQIRGQIRENPPPRYSLVQGQAINRLPPRIYRALVFQGLYSQCQFCNELSVW